VGEVFKDQTQAYCYYKLRFGISHIPRGHDRDKLLMSEGGVPDEVRF
jgi:hypothetical protein